jgi:hypothetical protein
MIWTKELDARFAKLVKANLTSPEIATVLGISRSAVMGKAHRMGLRVGNARTAADKDCKNAIPKARKKKEKLETFDKPAAEPSIPLKLRVGGDGHVGFYEHESKPLPAEISVKTNGVPILKNKGCACIIGDPKSGVQCGKPIARGSYCAEHAARIYVGLSPRQRDMSRITVPA